MIIMDYLKHSLHELYTYCCLAQTDRSSTADQIMFRNHVMCKINYIHTLNDVFWTDFSKMKDIYSYHFCKRMFPSVDMFGNIVDRRKDKPVDKDGKIQVRPRIKNTKHRRFQQYDIKSGLMKELNKNYTDESYGSGYNKLRRFQVHEHACADIIFRIIQKLLALHEHGLVLYVICAVLCSNELCHNMLGETGLHFMSLLPNTLKSTIIRKCMFQGMYILHKEECIAKTYASVDSRYVFTIDAVHAMPVFHGCITKNPYLSISLSEKYIIMSDISGDDVYLKHIRGQRGCYSLQDFHARFHIYTDHMFVGMNKDKLWFCGSLMAACAAKNPLELMFGISQNRECDAQSHWNAQTAELNAYFDEYYPSRAVLHDDSAEHMDQISDIDIMVNTPKDSEFDSRTHEIFNHVRCTVPDAVLNRINTKKSYKYLITGTKRNIEIFRVYSMHPLGCVARFHFPAVRAAYNGDQVYLLPSCVSYLQTGVFSDYKWMASSTDSKELILKYYIRGGVCMLNPTETELLKQYIQNSPRWQVLVQYQTSSKYADLNSPVFKPRKYDHGVYSGFPHKKYDNYQWIQNTDRQNPDSMESDTLRYPSGHIKPIHSWDILPHMYSTYYVTGC
jgi:hypothetical protein